MEFIISDARNGYTIEVLRPRSTGRRLLTEIEARACQLAAANGHPVHVQTDGDSWMTPCRTSVSWV